MTTTRTETDLLGARDVPEPALWGIHTARAAGHFRVTELRTSPALLRALAQVKRACCTANAELGYLAKQQEEALLQACDEVIRGEHLEQFPLDALQGGAGTSTNMNMNEVLANRALEIMGFMHGDYQHLHPIEHVNLHQSTNDVYPTALKVAGLAGLRALSREVETLQGVFQTLEKRFADIPKVGRTEMMDAVPMTLGAEFSAFAEAIGRDRWRTFKCEERLRTVNLGGTSVGTGLTAPRRYIFLVIEKLREVTGFGLLRGENTVDQTANADAFVEVSGILKALACNIDKISRDLRLLHAEGEIHLPPVQAGSSIMPGKVNPVILECAMQCAMKAQANDMIVASCASRGTLQINEFLPLLGTAFLENLHMLKAVCSMLAGHLADLQASPETCARRLHAATALITPFLPLIGYEHATRLVNAFAASGEHDFRACLARELGPEAVETALAPQSLTALGHTLPVPPLTTPANAQE